MADNDWWAGEDDDYAMDDSDKLSDLLFGNDYEVDQHAQDLFKEAFFNQDERAYTELNDYLYFEYDIDFELAFEWYDFREWAKENGTA